MDEVLEDDRVGRERTVFKGIVSVGFGGEGLRQGMEDAVDKPIGALAGKERFIAVVSLDWEGKEDWAASSSEEDESDSSDSDPDDEI